MAQTTSTSTQIPTRLTVLCGANVEHLDEIGSITIARLRNQLKEALNITGDHTIVLVDGKEVQDSDFELSGREEVEFKKPSGTKG